VGNHTFEQLFRNAARVRKVSRELESLLERVYDTVEGEPRALKVALEDLVMFLTTPAGRTDANVCVTDSFFSVVEEWGKSLDAIPPGLRSIINDIGGTLHDTIYAPHIASNFESLPEQLLERLRKTKV
jgi:hypothetical protein